MDQRFLRLDSISSRVSTVYFLIMDDSNLLTPTLLSDSRLSHIGALLLKGPVPKNMIGWDLEELERIALDVQAPAARESDSDDESVDSSDSPAML